MASNDTGLIGWPVSHSLSPIIHGYWRSTHSISGDYVPVPISPEELAEKIKKTKASGLRGFNVTVPHKQAIIPFLDVIDATAQHIGAVNTAVRDGSTWRGTNTDAYGFIAHMRDVVGDVSPYLKKVVILGAGGASRAIIVGLQEAGAKDILLLNRTKQTADILAAEFGIASGDWNERNDLLENSTLVVNTTSLGMKGQPPLEIDLKKTAANAAVYDIVYAPLETEILASARRLKRLAVDGLGMLLYQAQKAFEEWHGILPAVDQGLRDAVLDEIKRREEHA